MDRQRRFTADVSHELRSPIASIRTQLDVAAMDPAGVSVAHAAPDLLAELDRVEALMADLLTMARLDATSAPMTAVDLRELIGESIGSRIRHQSRPPVSATTNLVVEGVPACAPDEDAAERIGQCRAPRPFEHRGRCVTGGRPCRADHR